MSTYKVIQDIEAEDKLLGPLTLRQFIYAAIVAVLGFVVFKLITVSPFIVIPFLPPMIFFAMLAAPFGHDQSSEVWLLAKIRFFLKPRRRIWDQTGLQELVTITVPKKVEKHLTDGLSQIEVKSRLQALANTIDSRGWAVKNVTVNAYSQPSYLAGASASSDRLVDTSNLPQEVQSYEVYAQDDILDENNNRTAQNLDNMINQSEQSHRQALMASVQGNAQPPQAPASYMFMDPAVGAAPLQAISVAPAGNPAVNPAAQSTSINQGADDTTADRALLDRAKSRKELYNQNLNHLRTVSPVGRSNPHAPASHQPTAQDHSTAPPKVASNTVARLASNDDLSVATIAHEAHKAAGLPENEVIISLR